MLVFLLGCHEVYTDNIYSIFSWALFMFSIDLWSYFHFCCIICQYLNRLAKSKHIFEWVLNDITGLLKYRIYFWWRNQSSLKVCFCIFTSMELNYMTVWITRLFYRVRCHIKTHYLHFHVCVMTLISTALSGHWHQWCLSCVFVGCCDAACCVSPVTSLVISPINNTDTIHTHFMCFTACDDDCAGLLIRDVERLLRLIGSVNLTLPLPLPYKVLYRFENMTEELKVSVRTFFFK